MPTQSYDALLRTLKKGEPAAAYYLYGPEDILKDEAIRAILDRALDPGFRDFNFDQRSASQLQPEEVEALCATLPMMAERRVVLIRDVEAWKRRTKAKAAVLHYLARPSPETVLILVQSAGEEKADGDLVKHTTSITCEPLPPERVAKWVAYRAGPLGVTFAEGGADYLIKAVGSDLGALESELQKLASLPDSANLGAEQIGNLVGVRHGETVYDWRDAVLADEAGRAISLLDPVLAQSGVTGVRLVTLLGTSLIGLGLARANYDKRLRGRPLESALINTLRRVRPFGLGNWNDEVAAWSRAVERWPAGRISGALRETLEADRALKATTISGEEAILTDLILRLTVATRKEVA